MSGEPDPDEPVGYLVLPKGTPVVSSDGVTVGKVRKVQHHARERFFDGLVVQTGDGPRFVDAPEVGLLTRRRVTLEITAEEVRALPAPDGLLAPIETEAKRLARRIRRRFPGG